MHLHLPDGVLPLWLWIAGYILTVGFLLSFLPYLKKHKEKFPLIGLLIALLLLIMSIPLGLPVHLNLMILVGLSVGPIYSLWIAFLVNLILATFGHGGLTVVGLNTLLLWGQALMGIFLFTLFKKIKNHFLRTSLAAFLSLIISYGFLIGLIKLAQINPSNFLPHYHHHEHLQISLKTYFLITSPLILWTALLESLITGFIWSYLNMKSKIKFQKSN